MTGRARPAPRYPHVSPSVLSADFTRLDREIARVVGPRVSSLHLDVMDGQFVPNISYGPLVIEAVNRLTPVRLETHLMVVEPRRLIAAFVRAGSDQIAVHVEPRAVRDVRRTLRAIRDEGADAAVALNPETPVDRVFPYLDLVAQVLVMSVSPGFGGQPFRPAALRKIRALRRLRDERGLRFRIGVDGGVTPETAPACLDAGADVLVAGTAVFKAGDPAGAISRMEGEQRAGRDGRRRSGTVSARPGRSRK